MADGKISFEWWALGSNGDGQLVIGNTDDQKTPQKTLFCGSFVCGGRHTLMWESKSVWEGDGRGGIGKELVFSAPVRFVSCGWTHMAAILENGSLWTWGSNGHGELGREGGGEEVGLVAGLRDVTDVSCGFSHTVASIGDGRVCVFGSSRHGEDGEGTSGEGLRWVSLGEDDKEVYVCSGKYWSLAWCRRWIKVWGWSRHGQCGQKERWCHVQDVKVDAAIQKCATGWSHALALTEDGQVFGWGRCDMGQTGRDGEELGVVLDGCTDISCGTEHSLVVRKDGIVMGTGWNEHGNLGEEEEIVSTFREIPFSGKTATRVSAGGASTFILAKH